MNDLGIDVLGMEEIEVENTSIDEIDNENVNLIFVGIDCSGSMSNFTSDMQKSLRDFKDALENSKEVDEILVARADFNNVINVGGYKKVNEFDISYNSNDMTSLYDVIVDGTDKLLKYIEFLKNQGMRVKAVFSIFSDGDDTCSRNTFSVAKNAINKLNNEEITTAFISFGGGALREATNLGFKNILNVGGSASELRKSFNCLSKSVIESSKSVVNNTDDFFTM